MSHVSLLYCQVHLFIYTYFMYLLGLVQSCCPDHGTLHHHFSFGVFTSWCRQRIVDNSILEQQHNLQTEIKPQWWESMKL